MKPGDVLVGVDGGSAVVVTENTSPMDGLLDILEAEYGGDRFDPANPALVAAVSLVKIQTWWLCTMAWKDSNPFNGDREDVWWSSDGDGVRTITVAYYEGSARALGDEAVTHLSPEAQR